MISDDPHGATDSKLWAQVYDELHSLAEHYFRQQSPQTLQPTALVHEAYVKLSASKDFRWTDRTHFFRTAALAMRQVLVDRARRRRRRGEARDEVAAAASETVTDPVGRAVDLIALDDALQHLAADYPRESRVVELRYFGGLSVEQAAKIEAVSVATVKRDWAFARAWLLEEMGGS